jgi:hypothetical protein
MIFSKVRKFGGDKDLEPCSSNMETKTLLIFTKKQIKREEKTKLNA